MLAGKGLIRHNAIQVLLATDVISQLNSQPLFSARK